MIFTIGQTAKAVGLSKTTICKHIENGKLSATWNEETNPRQREIDASEIKRVYGVDMMLPPSQRTQFRPQVQGADTPLDMVLRAKDELIATLKTENTRLAEQIEAKDEQLAAANRLLAAPRPDPYAAALERLDALAREFEAKVAADQAPAPVAPPAPAKRGFLGLFRRKAA